MSATKGKKKPTTPWFQCEKCNAHLPHESLEPHSGDCPPSRPNLTHYFALNGSLYGCLDIKVNVDIKGTTAHERDNLVFVNQSCMQLCGFVIGEHVLVRDMSGSFPAYARVVWPTEEKSVVSVLLTKNAFETCFAGKNVDVVVSRILRPVAEASQVKLVAIDHKNLDVHPDLVNRIHKLCINRLLTSENIIRIMYYGRVLNYVVVSIDGSEGSSCENNSLEAAFGDLTIGNIPTFYKIMQNTKFVVFRDEKEHEQESKVNLLNAIGGLDEEISEIRDLMHIAIGKVKAVSQSLITRGVLLYGPSGTGKTVVAKALARESGVNITNLSMIELYNCTGDFESTVGNYFEDTIKYAPCILLIDDIELLCPIKSSRITDSDKKFIFAFLNFFDRINSTGGCKVFVLATSNKPDSIDPAFRRCGRLDREVEIPTPNPRGRLDILTKLLHGLPLSLDENDLKDIANSAHGYVGSDLKLLCSRAALHCVKRGDMKIAMQDLKFALTRVKPSAMREVQVEVPDVKWSDIGGQESLKLILRQAVEWPLKHGECFVRLGISPPRGVLMFGPPGCSKTMIAKALATESGLNFLSIKGPEVFSKWVGESERAVREVFRKARQVAPSIIFFDEIDALSGERGSGASTSVQERVLAQLLTELDGVTLLGDVTVLAATNRPDRIDKALLRPGRLDRIVYVPLPDEHTRREIFSLKVSKMPVVNVDLEYLVIKTEGYSGAEINAVCHEAAMKALERNLNADSVEMQHFNEALKIISPRTPTSLLEIYKNYLK